MWLNRYINFILSTYTVPSYYLSREDYLLDFEEKTDIYKPFLLFERNFFPDFPNYYPFSPSFSCSFNKGELNDIFCFDRFDEERIKCLPLLFSKVGDKDTFLPWVFKIMGAIKYFCTKNIKFAQLYQAKLVEMRNNYGSSLKERMIFYFDYPSVPLDIYEERHDLVNEIEQPSFEMMKCYVNIDRIENFFPVDMLFCSLLQDQDRIHIPHWDENDRFCRFILDYGLIRHSTRIIDEMFANYGVYETIQIICTHIHWRCNNLPQYKKADKDDNTREVLEQEKETYFKEYTKYLEDYIPQSYPVSLLSLYAYSIFSSLYFNNAYIFIDSVQYETPKFLCDYLSEKFEETIGSNNHSQILDISRLFQNADWNNLINWEAEEKKRMKNIQLRISTAINIINNWNNTAELRKLLNSSEKNVDFLQILYRMKKREAGNDTPLLLEEFIFNYVPLPCIDTILACPVIQEENEELYQNLASEYPGLSRPDALLSRLLPCFSTIAINNSGLPIKDSKNFLYPWKEINLYVFNQFCEMQKEKPELSEPILIVFFNIMYNTPISHDIIKKYPDIQEHLIDRCQKIITGTWDTSVFLEIHAYQIATHVPAIIIGIHKGAWYGLKQLLIALRKTREAWVNADLYYDGNYLHHEKYNLFWAIEIDYLEYFAKSLKSLRQDIANCLGDWLKPLPNSKNANLEKRMSGYNSLEKEREGFDISYSEPDPIWRYAYVRAIADLGVDVDGKGHYIHSIMDNVAQEDPSKMVREAAAKTSEELKKLRSGWAKGEHSQKIIYALWWFKQASRLALDLPINRNEALRNRNQNIKMGPSHEVTIEEEKELKAREKMMRRILEIPVNEPFLELKYIRKGSMKLQSVWHK